MLHDLRSILFFTKRGEHLKILSKFTGKEYMPELAVYLANPLQSAKYLSNTTPYRGELLDLIPDGEKIIFVFSKESTRELYQLWKNYELK